MSEHEDETPNFDDMGLSSDDLTFAEPGAEAAAEAEPAAEGAGEDASAASFDLNQDAEVAMAADEHTTAEEEHPEAPEEEGEPKKSLGMLFHVQWIVALAACVAVGLGFHCGPRPLRDLPHFLRDCDDRVGGGDLDDAKSLGDVRRDRPATPSCWPGRWRHS